MPPAARGARWWRSTPRPASCCGCTPSTRGRAGPRRPAVCRAAGWPTGPTVSEERVLYVTLGFRLVALDAATGRPVPGFGDGGRIDLKAAAVVGEGRPIDPVTGEIGLHATPTVARDVVVVGGTFADAPAPRTYNNTKGLVQAFDVRTGRRLWTFDTVPGPGERRRGDVAERLVGRQREQRRVDPDIGRPRAGHRLPAGGDAVGRTTTAATGRATTCSARASSPSTC